MTKKIFFLMAVLFTCLPGYADVSSESKKIHFVYIHGTAQNDEKSKNAFIEASSTLHSYIKKRFETSSIAKNNLLDGNNYVISEKPVIYYWGDKTMIESLTPNIDLTNKGFSLNPSKYLGKFSREMIAKVLHDAAWFVQESNKHLVLTELAKEIKDKTDDSYIVLLGHSAGSLVTFEFLKFRLPYFDEEAFRAAGIPLKLQANSKPPCLQSLLSSELVTYNDKGGLSLIKSTNEDIKNKLSSLDEYTAGLCLPKDKLKGVITFGSPIAIFLSSIEWEDSIDHYFAGKMLKYIYNNNLFWLHVNHRDDPIAIAFSEDDIRKTILAHDLIKNKRSRGFIVNDNSHGQGATFIGAHGWYWNKPNDFSKLLLQTYEDGYVHWVEKRSD